MILEICQLKVKPTLSPSDPSLLSALRDARTKLRSEIHDTSSQFWQCIEDPSLIYIFGLWPSMALHSTFQASSSKTSILAAQEAVFDFGFILHIPIGEGGMAGLPLQAPVIAIARLFGRDDEECVKRYDDALERNLPGLVEGTSPWKVATGWRVDCEEGKREALMITGWEAPASHGAFIGRVRAEDPDYPGIGDALLGVEAKHARNMEA